MIELAAQKQRLSGAFNQAGTAIVGRLSGLEIGTTLRRVSRGQRRLPAPGAARRRIAAAHHQVAGQGSAR